VPVPKKFDRRPPERDLTRINERIRVPEVRLIGEDGNQIGVIKTDEALRYAQERDLDLVEVAPEARPPVCRVLDYSKYKYEQAQKQKAARKHQQQITIREIKFRPKIAQHDYDTKKGHVRRFLRGKDKVKITIMFRGREVTHPERGTMLLDRLAEDLSDVGVIEQSPLQDGRNMTMMLGPSKAVFAGEKPEDAEQAGDGEKPATDGAGEKAATASAEKAAPDVEKKPESRAKKAQRVAKESEQDAAAEADGAEPSADGGTPKASNGSAGRAAKADKQPSPASTDAAV
jgi:translation initiation factor IF-3